GPGVDAGHLLAPVVARGEDQHRHGTAGVAPTLEHAQAIEQRQPEVKHNGVVGFGVALEVGIAAVVGLVDRVAGLLQAGANLRAQGRIVFDEQQSHGVAGGAGKAYGRVRSSRRSTWAVAASSSSLSNLPSGCNSL